MSVLHYPLSTIHYPQDMKLNLQETDYGQMLANETLITPPIIENRALNKLVTEFFFLRSPATAPLSEFLDYITYEYMIENVMLLLRGTLSGRNVNELMAQCHPLGMFKESTMRNIPSFEASPRGYAELYETVLVDTPVGEYFQQYLDQSSNRVGSASEVRGVLEEVQIEILKNSLMKLYLEDFYRFCERLGGETETIMCELLRARADRCAINITLNSFGTPLNDPVMRESHRRGLYPSIGALYPEGTELLAAVDEDAKLVQALSYYPVYRTIFERFLSASADEFSIDDEFYKHEVGLFELAFESQVHSPSPDASAMQCPDNPSFLLPSDALRCLLRLREAQGAGDTQSGVDRRVHPAAPERPNRQLHSHIPRRRSQDALEPIADTTIGP
jgi:V-type H+-transporting ATPase subunit d